MRFLNITHDLTRIKKSHETILEKMSSQKKINRLSDDPVGMSKILNWRETLSSLEQARRNIGHAQGFTGLTETSLTAANEHLIRVHQLAIAEASGTATAETRAIAAKELKEIIEEMLSLANAAYNGRHIFGGSQTAAAPFSLADPAPALSAVTHGSKNSYNGTASASGPFLGLANRTYVLQITRGGTLADAQYRVSPDGGLTWGAVQTGLAGPVDLGEGVQLTFTAGTADMAENDTFFLEAKAPGYYRGNTGDLTVGLGRNLSLPYNISGREAFVGFAPGVGVDVFQVLLDLRDGLLRDDTAEIQASIDRVAAAQNQLIQATASVGAKMKRLELAANQIDGLIFDLTALISEAEDADMVDLISRFTGSEAALKASYQVAARIGGMSLVDFLR